MAGQTAGPNWLTFFREPMGNLQGNIDKKLIINFKHSELHYIAFQKITFKKKKQIN